MKTGYLLGLAGMWLLADAWFSLVTYIGKPEQSWWKDHSIRIIRGLIAIGLMIVGYWI